MNLESILYYSTHHSETIIQWLFFAILVMSGYVIARAIFTKREPGSATGSVNSAVFADGSDIQDFLKKILDQTSKLETVKLEGMSPAAVGEVDAQVQTLKRDLAVREEELTKLKAAGSSNGDAEKLSARIKELETKLAEYEILEDDIADLSLYKDENVRLRGELDKLKLAAGGADAAAPEPRPNEDVVAEFANAVNQESTSLESVGMQLPSTGDPLADFETAVNLEKKIQGIESPVAPPPVAARPTPPAPVASASPASPPEGEGEDLFAEFANPPADPTEEASLDTDKMMEEMAALVSMEPSQGTALQEEIDTDKMAMEATRLTKS